SGFRLYGRLRDLHSFPTRRSSDLAHPVPGDVVARTRGVEPLPQLDILHGLPVGCLPAIRLPHMDPLRYAVLEIVGVGVDAHPRQDRKSTRLNSSHVKISYAVFCLK